MPKKKAAILIGASQRGSGEFRELLGVDNDLSNMHGFLRHRAGYQIVHELRERSKAEVLSKLRLMAGDLSPGDQFLVYFSGHGHWVNGQHVLLCPGAQHNTMDLLEDVIPVELIRRYTDRRDLERVLILDCCRDSLYQAVTRGGGDAGLRGASYLKDIGDPETGIGGAAGSFSVFCGCDEGQVAVEIPGLNRGLFTTALLEVMEIAANERRELRLTDQVIEQVAVRMRELGRNHPLPVIPVPWKSGPAPVILEGNFLAPVAPLAIPATAPLSFEGEVGRVVQALKLRVDLDGPFTWEMYVQLARKLQSLDAADAEGRGLLADADAFAEGEFSAAAFVSKLHAPRSRPQLNSVTAKSLARPTVVADSTFTNSVGMKFARIEPGNFMMGSPEEEEGRQNNETLHQVTFSRPYFMAVHHVTRGQFAEFIRASGHATDAEKEGWAYAHDGRKWHKVDGASWTNPGFEQTDDHPVVEVSWNDAMAYCQWLSQQEGKSYRLTTEAEWEYACRNDATDTKPFNTGVTISTDQANYDGDSVYANGIKGVNRKGTTAVGTFPANGRGLFDMHGNAWQWCHDVYANYAPGKATDSSGSAQTAQNAFGPRVLRGGSWNSFPVHCRSAFRYDDSPDYRSFVVGFRVVLDAR